MEATLVIMGVGASWLLWKIDQSRPCDLSKFLFLHSVGPAKRPLGPPAKVISQ